MSQTLFVFPARSVVASHGVCEGEPIAFASELIMDDTYQISSDSCLESLCLSIETAEKSDHVFRISEDSETGVVGARVVLDCSLTFMATNGATYEALVFVELNEDIVRDVYFMPLAIFDCGINYRLVDVNTQDAKSRFAQVACVSFTRGTRITMATGAQTPVQELRVGDQILTRDDGVQRIRWIGHTTLRAVGDFAPVLITKGALNNIEDLMVSPDHRLFVYQRQDRLGVGRAEVLVKARYLINGKTVYQKSGGFIDYYQLLFDEHQIIYAEGIAAETLLMTPRTSAAFSSDDVETSEHTHRTHFNYDVSERVAPSINTVDLLREASSNQALSPQKK